MSFKRNGYTFRGQLCQNWFASFLKGVNFKRKEFAPNGSTLKRKNLLPYGVSEGANFKKKGFAPRGVNFKRICMILGNRNIVSASFKMHYVSTVYFEIIIKK